MKRITLKVLLAVWVPMVISCSGSWNQGTPQGYVRHCVRLLDKNALYADSPQWRLTKDSILTAARTLSTFEEAHGLVSRAAAVAGGKHSRAACRWIRSIGR